jgi:hypothetical protein
MGASISATCSARQQRSLSGQSQLGSLRAIYPCMPDPRGGGRPKMLSPETKRHLACCALVLAALRAPRNVRQHRRIHARVCSALVPAAVWVQRDFGAGVEDHPRLGNYSGSGGAEGMPPCPTPLRVCPSLPWSPRKWAKTLAGKGAGRAPRVETQGWHRRFRHHIPSELVPALQPQRPRSCAGLFAYACGEARAEWPWSIGRRRHERES